MLRRFLCMGMLLIALGVAGCSGDTKPSQPKAPPVPDPEGGAKVIGPAGKAG